MLGKLHHISITCQSIQPCIEFYSRFGFEEEKRYEDEELIISLLKSAHGGHIELFEFKVRSAHRQEREFLDIGKRGISHLALEVEDLNECYAELCKQQQCSPIKKARLGGFQYFFTTDPSDNNVEIIATD